MSDRIHATVGWLLFAFFLVLACLGAEYYRILSIGGTLIFLSAAIDTTFTSPPQQRRLNAFCRHGVMIGIMIALFGLFGLG